MTELNLIGQDWKKKIEELSKIVETKKEKDFDAR